MLSAVVGSERHDGLRVVVVDDHPMFREGLRVALETGTEITVVGEAERAGDAVDLVDRTDADLVVMDLHLPDGSGLKAVEALRAARPGLAVLVMTMSEDDDAIAAALRAGARGYLLKSAGRTEVLDAIRAVAHGGSVFSARVAARLTALVSQSYARRGAFAMLTERECEILDLVARGYDNRRIAADLHLSDKTVRNHVSNVMAKLDAASRAEAIVRARDAGLGSGR
jgi:DNA-binding NarL/FixJ family response regulator